ncbi:putative cytotoxin [Rahnella aquatilis CIP 78.65 = ATCC 33071]|uniref:Putative cytotoxic protein n=1 Tax=Rahnella aquatilis (strain ATCC 33071 / DSM 4594 / JCM 1683 / NBRC 105701 / NCIMB 13365 / CIP 78.65) TaxID=745277 RepID=H2IYK2_RAHAC|nr:colicin E3/pyocin S6 family cytotoxin [Rahnella aquatilis]AEX50938.1 putative cytotoxic protein [Rahnella aquatilis CIP 78.65 = ATCC 33071]KFD18532.1 putative cytotoxin [Rahnella aquatilis CIP 78.65 = ATCC 33071]
MGYRSNCYGRGQALHGDKTTTGAVCLTSLPDATEHGLGVIRIGDVTTACPKCGLTGKITSGEPHSTFDGLASAVDGSDVLCGCPPGTNRVIAPAGQWMGRGKSPSELAREKWEAERAAILRVQAEKEAAEQARRSMPVFAKSAECGAGNTEARTCEEQHHNFGRMSYGVPTPVAGIKPEVEQHAQTAKRKKSASDKTPWYKKMFGGKADTPAQSGMPLALPVATGGGTELIASGMNALRGVTSIRSGSLFVNPVAVGVIGTFYSNKLNAGEKDILSDSQLAALAGKSAPTRIRFQWVKDKYGRLTPVAYHTGADSGQDQVRVRAMRRNTFTGNYEFRVDGAEKPTIIWTPDELEFKAPTNTGNRDEPYLPSTITVLPLPGAEELGSTSTSLPIPDEQSFDDYILVNLPHGMPPVYIYLSQSRSGIPNKDYDYHPAPETEEISGLSGLRQSKKKTPKQSGGGLRERWADSKGRRIYEWDSQHGELEEYRASDGEHLGSVDHKTGQQLKPAVKGRNIKRYL